MDVDNEVEGTGQTRHETPEFRPPPTTSGRQRRFPRQYEDFLPNSTTHLPHMPPKPAIPKPPTVVASSRSHSPVTETPEPTSSSVFKTDVDEFGLYRVYPTYPSSNPDEIQDLESRCDAPGLATTSRTGKISQWWAGFGCNVTDLARANVFAPFLNATVFRLMNWFYSGSSAKSVAELQSLVDDVLLAQDFKLHDLKGFNARRELRRLDEEADLEGYPVRVESQDRWRESTVKIRLPAEKVFQKELGAPILEIPGVYHRSLVEVVTTAFQDNSAKLFHYTPFSLFWKPTSDSPPERIYSEMYNSDVFLEEHQKIQELPPEPGPEYERVIAAIKLWSDSTHLAQFGSASLWPVYALFGNQSKYDSAKPSQFAAHHVAYLPSVGPFLTDVFLHLLKFLIASRYLSRSIFSSFWGTSIIGDNYTSKAGTVSCGLGIATRSRVFACV